MIATLELVIDTPDGGEFRYEVQRRPGMLVLWKFRSGEVYTVDLLHHTCTCPGFRFRKRCKHVAALQEVCLL